MSDTGYSYLLQSEDVLIMIHSQKNSQPFFDNIVMPIVASRHLSAICQGNGNHYLQEMIARPRAIDRGYGPCFSSGNDDICVVWI